MRAAECRVSRLPGKITENYAMANIGSWWLASCESQEGEKIVWSCLASHTEDFGAATEREPGGKLFLTNQRLLFVPHLLDYAVGGEHWATPLNGICKVDVQPIGEGRVLITGRTSFGGAVRDRLRITLQDGSKEIFFVLGLKEKIQRISDAVGSPDIALKGFKDRGLVQPNSGTYFRKSKKKLSPSFIYFTAFVITLVGVLAARWLFG